jgi:small subunit ribosomal protein S9
MAEETRFMATGRRKEAVARVILVLGKGEFKINNKPLDEYFTVPSYRLVVKQPLKLTSYLDKFNVQAKVKGGGVSGQAEAVRHGIAKALLKFNGNLRPTLKKAGFITRDPRMKERKKYGQKGARKRFQWTKR